MWKIKTNSKRKDMPKMQRYETYKRTEGRYRLLVGYPNTGNFSYKAENKLPQLQQKLTLTYLAISIWIFTLSTSLLLQF